MKSDPRYSRLHGREKQAGFIQAALLFGIALMTAILGGFALANRSPTAQTDTEQAKVNASVILKQASDLRDGVARYSSDFGSSSVINTMTFESTGTAGLFNPSARYASPQIMPTAAFAAGENTAIAAPTTATTAGHWHLNKATPGNDLASAAPDPMVLLAGLRPEVCSRVNILLYGAATLPTVSANMATWIGGASAGTFTGAVGWPEGCVQTSDNKYVYFKAIQEN